MEGTEAFLTDGLDVSNEGELISAGDLLDIVLVEEVSTSVVGVLEESGVAVKLGDGVVIDGGLGVDTCIHIVNVLDKDGLVGLEIVELSLKSSNGSVVEVDGILFLSFVVSHGLDGVSTEVHERGDKVLDGGLVRVLGDLDETHDHWADVGGVARFVSGSEEFHGGVLDLNESSGFLVEEGFKKSNTLVNGFEETVVITLAGFVKSGFLCASGVEAFELVVDALLLGAVGVEDSLALSTSIGTGVLFVGSTVTSEFGVRNFTGTEFLLFVTVNSLLGLKLVVFALFILDLSGEVVKHSVDVFDWSSSLHHVGDLSEDSLLSEEGWVLELGGLGERKD